MSCVASSGLKTVHGFSVYHHAVGCGSRHRPDSRQLLLGFNDGWYNDNGEGITVKVSDVPAVPEPGAVGLALAGLGITVWARRKSGASAAA